jgi:hypothetical protein
MASEGRRLSVCPKLSQRLLASSPTSLRRDGPAAEHGARTSMTSSMTPCKFANV